MSDGNWYRSVCDQLQYATNISFYFIYDWYTNENVYNFSMAMVIVCSCGGI